MFFFIRFTYIAILLIFTQLLIPSFSPGSRFLILCIAAASGLSTLIFRKMTTGRLTKKLQVLLCGIGIIIILLFFSYHFTGVKLNFLGILVTYLGVVLLETLLPNEWYELIYQRFWKKD